MRRALLAASWLFSAAITLWAFFANPFAVKAVELGAVEIHDRIEQMMLTAIADGTLASELEAAVARADSRRVDALLTVAETRDVVLPQELAGQARRMALRDADQIEKARSCLACSLEISDCRTMSEIALCAIPVELTPLGDVNALRRQAGNYWRDEPIDQLELGLAVLGLGATTVVLATGGSSAIVKAGATTARVANRLGNLSDGLRLALRQAADIPIRWSMIDDFVMQRKGIEAVTDVAQLSRLSGLAGDAGRIARRTSAADAIVLMRHADDPAELTRVARVADAMGPETRGSFELLGKARVMRATERAASAVIAALAALAGLVAGVITSAASWALSRLFRRVLRS